MNTLTSVSSTSLRPKTRRSQLSSTTCHMLNVRQKGNSKLSAQIMAVSTLLKSGQTTARPQESNTHRDRPIPRSFTVSRSVSIAHCSTKCSHHCSTPTYLHDSGRHAHTMPYHRIISLLPDRIQDKSALPLSGNPSPSLIPHSELSDASVSGKLQDLRTEVNWPTKQIPVYTFTLYPMAMGGWSGTYSSIDKSRRMT